MSYTCFQIASASSARSAVAMASVRYTERVAFLDLYDLHETGIVLLDISVSGTIRPGVKDKSSLFANTASLLSIDPECIEVEFWMQMDAPLSCAYLMSIFSRLYCFLDSCSKHSSSLLCYL